jgi:hypothetical protein
MERRWRAGEKLSSVSGDQADVACWLWKGFVEGLLKGSLSNGVATTAVWGLMSFPAASSSGNDMPMTILLLPGVVSSWNVETDAVDGLFLSQAQFPIDPALGDPSRALKALASENLPCAG